MGPYLTSLLLLAGVAGCSWVATRPPRAADPAAAQPSSPAAVTVDTTASSAPPVLSISADEAAAYLGDAACARCHRDEAAAHRASRHARTMRRVGTAADRAAFQSRQLVRDPVRRLTYRPNVAEGSCVIEAFGQDGWGQVGADYVLGSGKDGMTFLAQRDEEAFLKLRLSYYPRARQWSFTPSQGPNDLISSTAGETEAGVSLDRCLQCHVTTLRRDAGRLNLTASHLGIGCERCHGPARAHAVRMKALQRETEMERLGKASPARITELCGACHHNSANADPSDPHVRDSIPRFQGLALEQSACYRKSGKLSCISCHDPHGNADGETARSERTCVSCHSAAPQRTCGLRRTSGCTGCHMPRQPIPTIPFAHYRNHCIRVWPQSPSARNPEKKG